MARITTFKEFAKSQDGVTTYAAATLALGGETSDVLSTEYYSMKNYDKIVGFIVAHSVVATHILTVKMSQGTDTAGAGSATISGKSTTYTSSQVTDVFQAAIEVDADDLTDGYDYVGMQVSTDDADGTEAVGLILVPMNPRYGQATMPA